MGADFEVSIDSSGKPQLLYIDKGNKNINVGSQLSDFTMVKELGKGNFGSVFLVTSKLTKKVYALKEIKREMYNDEQRLEVEKEIRLLKDLNHPHVIKYFTSFIENGNFYIIIEYINGGSLENLYNQVKSEGKLIREKMIWDFLIQTLSGLVYLHENKKIIHRDIKPDNLLLDKENGLKISDFGISAVYKNDVDDLIKCHQSRVGPIAFMAQEIAEGKEYDFKSDIYMLGLTFYFMLTGVLPESKKRSFGNNFEVIKKQNSDEIIPQYYSEELKHFINTLLLADKNQRPSAKKAFAKAISYYTIKYLKITSILATLECFLAIPSIGPYFRKDKISDKIKNDVDRKYIVTKIIKEALDYANPYNFNYEKLKLQCWKLRVIFYVKNGDFEKKSLEIDTITLVEDICNNLHRELNRGDINNFQNPKNNNNINENYTDDKGGKIDEADEQSVITWAVKKFRENFKSKISDQIYFLLKTVYQCPECKNNIKYLTSFNCACCLNPERCALWLNKKILNINELLKHRVKTRLFSDMNMNCKFCKKMQKSINITKKLYTSPYNLILGFDYADESKFIINIEENINISEFVERTDICKTFLRLVGAIFIERDVDDTNKYVSFSKDINGQWIYCNGTSVQNSSLYDLQNHKGIQALFYTTL